MVTHKEIMQLEYDKKQTQFTLDGTLIINKKLPDEQTPLPALINESHKWICPFCLNESNKFIIENKGLIKCPNCSNLMKIKTLLFIKDCSNEEYARWVFDYRLSGFFKKINFEQWINQLKTLGMSYEFWGKYKQLKGEYEKEETEPEFNEQETEQIIKGLMTKIKQGMNRQDLIIDIEQQQIDFDINTFDYCFNEATLRIKQEGLMNDT